MAQAVKGKKMNKELNIQLVSANELIQADYNPRKWSKKAISDLKQSISRFGLIDPIICNSAESRKNIIIGGHFRLHVAKMLGIDKVPVLYLEIQDIEKEKELNLRLNKNTGEFDLDLLKAFNTDLLYDVGFSSSDLASVFECLKGVTDEYLKTKDEIKEVKSKNGDLYQLGNHRLLCGDSTNLESVKRLMNGEKADVIYSDMPYNISLDYDKGFGGKSKYGGHTNDSKSEDEYIKFVEATITNAYKNTKKDAHFFWYCDENYIWLVQTSYKKIGITHKRVCIWVKNSANPTPEIAFNKSFEICVYGVRGKPDLNPLYNLNGVLNQEVTTGNDSIQQLEKITNLWVEKRLPTNQYNHPTEKSPTLHEKPLRRCSKQGDIVLDLFAGSGSTLIACEQIGRKCYTLEMEPTFCDLIINRYQKMTGKQAVLLENSYGAQQAKN